MKPIYSDIQAVQADFRKKKKLKFIFFWGHTLAHEGVIDKAVLSQWYPASFEVNGVFYPTAEHFMMAEKALIFNAEDIRREILATPSPHKAKELGRLIPHFSEEIWKQKSYEVVVQGNLAKFEQNLELKNFLLSTAPRILVEASPVDSVWGIGLAQNDPKAENPLLWNGLNLLGFALMEVRNKLGNFCY